MPREVAVGMGWLDGVFTTGVFSVILAVFAVVIAVGDASIAEKPWAKRVRVGFVVVALLLAVGECYSIYRDRQRAIIADGARAKQVRDLNTQVSSLNARVSTSNTRVSNLNGQVSNLNGQIAVLRKQLVGVASRRDVENSTASIQGAVNRAAPKAAAPLGPAILGHFTWVQSRIASDSSSSVFGLQVIIQTTVSSSHVSLLIECDGPISTVRPEFAGIIQANPYAGIPNPAHPNIAMIQYTVTPAFAPDNPITVDLYAKSNLRVVRVTSV